MRRVATFAAICLYAGSIQAQNNVTIKASIKGLDAGLWVYWNPLTSSEERDSVKTTPGGFQINLQIPDGEADAYVVRIGRKYVENSLTFLYLDRGTVTIQGDGPLFKDAKTSGSQAIEDNTAYGDFIKGSPQLAGREALYKKANDLYQKKDSLGYAALEPELKRMDSTDNALTEQWILQHPSSPISAFLLSFNLGRLDLDKKAAIFNQLTPEARSNAPAKRIAHSIRVNELTGIGKTAMDFTQNDTSGKPVSLKDFRGKYVLVDFWASWCVPCRGENPNVVAAYNKYKDKNFTVISVSLDQPNGKDKWLDAIRKDQLTWTNVSDLKFWNNAVAKQYDINSIPANLLLDPDGKIIAKDLHGAELDKKLSEVLKEVVFAGRADKKYDGDKVVLYNRVTNDHDSAYVRDGQFTFSVPFKGPTRYMFYSEFEMKSKGGYSPFGILVTEPGEILIDADIDNFPASKISGSKEQDLYSGFTAESGKAEQRIMDQLTQKYGEAFMKKPDPRDDRYKQLVKDYDSLNIPAQKGEMARLNAFVKANPGSFSAVYLLDSYDRDMDLKEVEALYGTLTAAYKDSRNGKHIAAGIEARQITAIGKTAPDFAQPDTSGNMVKLSDFRGKYVLLDFWASWCGPCRAENPNVVKAFNEYRDKGFTVLSVSLDQPGKKAAWLSAIHKDGLAWTQVSDLKFWDNEAVLLYGISAVPTNLLLDPKGKIIAKDLRGEDLEKKLDAVLK